MKTILSLLLLACGVALADDCPTPRMSVENFNGNLIITWPANHPCWFMQQSTNLIQWRAYTGPLNKECPDGTATNCYWYAVTAIAGGHQFYRLQRL